MLEVIASLALFGIGMSATMPMLLYASAQKTHQQALERAHELMMAEFERLGAIAYADLPASVDPVQIQTETGQRYVLDVDVDAGDDLTTWEEGDADLDYNLKRITVSVSWRSLGTRLRSTSLAQLRLRS